MDDAYLFVVPVNGAFLCSYDNADPVRMPADECHEELVAFDGTVRTFGHPDNVATIDYLCQRAEAVEFCSDGRLFPRLSPQGQIGLLQQFAYSTNHGARWFEVNQADNRAIHLSAVARHLSVEQAMPLLRQHPVWPALSFIATVHAPAVCATLGLLCDIRFFYHPVHTARIGQLLNFLGVRPHVLRQYVDGVESPETRKLATVIMAWSGTEYGPTEELLHKPSRGHFLSSLFVDAPTSRIGLLRATQLFVQYLRMTWLCYRDAGKQRQFDPGLFFKRRQDAAEYTNHLRENFPKICPVDGPVTQD